jgi:hypothetical protein
MLNTMHPVGGPGKGSQGVALMDDNDSDEALQILAEAAKADVLLTRGRISTLFPYFLGAALRPESQGQQKDDCSRPTVTTRM